MHIRKPPPPLFVFVGLVLIAALVIGIKRWERPAEVGKRTAGTGLPLTIEQQSVDFRHADLSFEVFPSRQRIAGDARLDFAVRRPIRRIQFDLDPELPIESITVNGAVLERGSWRNNDGLVAVNLPRPFQAGEQLQLGIRYGGKPRVAKKAPWDDGIMWSTTKAGKPWIATTVEGGGCDFLWPCFDNSLVEIPSVDLHITVPKGLVAPANGRLIGVTRLDDGRRTFHWHARSPNNYSIALDVAPYRELKAVYRSRFGNSIPLHYWYLPGEEKQTRLLFAEFAPTLDFLESVIGPYPFSDEKVGVVETPHLGMEHQTINAYGNAYRPAPEGYDWLFNHEFSHEWFGNQLTNADWDDMWLHEGFAQYMQPLFLQWRDGQMAYDAAMWKQRQGIANRFPIVSGKHRLEEEVYGEKTGPATDIYNKGSWVLHTLRGLIGDDAFFRATRRLVYGRPDPRPGNFRPRFGSTDEFVKIASEESGRDLRWFFNVYLRRAALPKLVTRRDGNVLKLQWRTPGGLPFPMPVDLLVDGKLQKVLMNGGHGTVALPSPDSHWVIDPNARVLRQSDAIDRYRIWDAKQKAKGGAKPS